MKLKQNQQMKLTTLCKRNIKQMKNTQIQTENTHRIVKQGIKQNQKKYPENIETDDPLQTENEVKQTEESDIHTYQQIPRDKINKK